MKVKIETDTGMWAWKVYIGGRMVLGLYTTRRACIRGLWRWARKFRKDLGLALIPVSLFKSINDAIRESRSR